MSAAVSPAARKAPAKAAKAAKAAPAAEAAPAAKPAAPANNGPKTLYVEDLTNGNF